MDEYDYRISWVAPEYEHREHGNDWFWAVGIITVSLAVAFVIIGDTLLSIIILLGMGMLLYHAKHEPKNIEYELSKKGVRTGATLYPWETLESFWVLEKYGGKNEDLQPKLLLTSKKALMPHLVILLSETVLEEVHQSMSHMLPEIPQVEPLPERLMRIVGF